MNLENATVYDIETFPNAFTLRMSLLNTSHLQPQDIVSATWRITDYHDDRRDLITWFNYLNQTQTPMIGFNNVHFDYPVIHYIFHNPHCTVRQIYDKAMSIISSNDRFGNVIWASDRFAPQIDLFKINHFDNPAKSTNLKALQINMRSKSVVDMPVEVGTVLTKEQVENLLIPYNAHDVDETKAFAHYNMEAIKYRLSLINDFDIDVLNWPDTKIGARMMEKRLGNELCYDYSTGRRQTRQTVRTRIALNDIIFPYVNFANPAFQGVLDYLKTQVLTTQDLEQLAKDETPTIKTKGVFTNLKASTGGIDFYFGTGGIHGSVSSQRITATEEWLIRDIDVASLYPSIAIVNRLAPAHLGDRFVQVYGDLPLERKKWQKEKGKKCVEANTLKLASNGVYGNSNNKYSVFYDPQFTLTITVNGQLLLCMLAERLMNVPTLKIIQINTDGITYYIHRDHEPTAAAVCKAWSDYTQLVLEDANYSRMWIRDVNNYIAESPDGSLKLKGAYWSPDPLDYHASVSAAQPPAWHKDLGNVVSIRAAVAAMVHSVDPATFIRLTTNPFDFMCRIKVKRSDALFWGEQQIQRNTRYYISTDGRPLSKSAPPTGAPGTFKKSPKISDYEYNRVMKETGGQWDARVCTKNKSVHETRLTGIEAGHRVTICNDVNDFKFENVNYDYYINEARKLIV
jgi:hypothetical protein